MTAQVEGAGLSHAGDLRPARLGPLVQYALLAGPLLSMLDSSIMSVAVEPIARELLHDMLADLPPEQAADETEFVARLGQFSLLDSSERAAVLAARTRAVRDQLAHYRTQRDLAVAHGERWGALVTDELIRRHERELVWLAELGELAARPEDPAPEQTGAES